MIWWLGLIVLVVSFIENTLWAFYIKYASDGNMLRAAIFGEVITVVGLTVFYTWIDSIWYCIPTIIGGFFGTLYSEKVKKMFKL